MNSAGLYRPIVNNEDNECFSYELDEAMRTEYGTVSGTLLIIDELSTLEEDYKKVK